MPLIWSCRALGPSIENGVFGQCGASRSMLKMSAWRVSTQSGSYPSMATGSTGRTWRISETRECHPSISAHNAGSRKGAPGSSVGTTGISNIVMSWFRSRSGLAGGEIWGMRQTKSVVARFVTDVSDARRPGDVHDVAPPIFHFYITTHIVYFVNSVKVPRSWGTWEGSRPGSSGAGRQARASLLDVVTRPVWPARPSAMRPPEARKAKSRFHGTNGSAGRRTAAGKRRKTPEKPGVLPLPNTYLVAGGSVILRT